MEVRAGIVEGYFTPMAAQNAASAVAHLTPQESETMFARMGGMTPSKSTLDRLPKGLSERWETARPRFEAAVRADEEVPNEILADLVKTTPGDEGKWFAAAKEAGLYDEALVLARRTPCDPKTLARAARDFAEDRPAFAVEAGMLPLEWLVQGYGYEIDRGRTCSCHDAPAIKDDARSAN